MQRLSTLNVGNFVNLRMKKYKVNNSKVIEKFWHNEFALHNIRGEWFSLPTHLKEKFMSEMKCHEASGCTTFRGVKIATFINEPNQYLTPEQTREQWKDQWDRKKGVDFKPSSNCPRPSAEYNKSSFFSPHTSFNTFVSKKGNCQGRIGVISSNDKKSSANLKGKKCFYLVKVIIPSNYALTPRDLWLLSRIKFGCTDDAEARLADIQVGGVSSIWR